MLVDVSDLVLICADWCLLRKKKKVCMQEYGGAKPIEKVAEKVEILTGWPPLSLQKWLVNTQQIFTFDMFFPSCW